MFPIFSASSIRQIENDSRSFPSIFKLSPLTSVTLLTHEASSEIACISNLAIERFLLGLTTSFLVVFFYCQFFLVLPLVLEDFDDLLCPHQNIVRHLFDFHCCEYLIHLRIFRINWCFHLARRYILETTICIGWPGIYDVKPFTIFFASLTKPGVFLISNFHQFLPQVNVVWSQFESYFMFFSYRFKYLCLEIFLGAFFLKFSYFYFPS